MDTSAGKRRRTSHSENESGGDSSVGHRKKLPVTDKFGLQSQDHDDEATAKDAGLQARIPLSPYDLDRLEYHIDLEVFGKGLQQAVDAVFPNNSRSKYKGVHALLLSWEDEDPKLPVSIEVAELLDVFGQLYGFDTEAWLIPSKDSHRMTNKKIDDFLGGDNPENLKIVYYAGHGRLTSNGQSAWTSRRNKRYERCPIVKWSGIQNMLEEAKSDVLILLDCCASGCVNTDEGAGVTELLAACAFNGEANGVGPYSFTRALLTQLRYLSSFPSFTTGVLFNRLYAEIQGWRFIGEKLQKPPVHLVLTQDHRLPRSIQLCRPSSLPMVKEKANITEQLHLLQMPSKENQTSVPGQASPSQDSIFSAPDARWSSPNTSQSPNSAAASVDTAAFPRLLFSVRLQEDVKGKDLSEELFKDWLRMIPVLAGKIKVEAGFASDSTLMLISLPAALLRFLPPNPAIQLLGLIRSSNLLANTNKEAAISTQPSSKSLDISLPKAPLKSTLKDTNSVPIRLSDKAYPRPENLSGSEHGYSRSPQVSDAQKLEARRRRRESHNLVERRRRDNILERIAELSQLVPARRLEEEKLRNHVQHGEVLSTNQPEFPELMPLSGITRDTNKGEILNCTVSWTRDLMWMLNKVMQQETKLAEIITDLGGTFPFEPTEDEKRLISEWVDVATQNHVQSFHYSRSASSSLRSPVTNVTGDRLTTSDETKSQAQSFVPISHWHTRLTPAATVSTSRSSVDSPDLRTTWIDSSGTPLQRLSPPKSPS